MTAQPHRNDFLPSLQRSTSQAIEPIQREFNRLFDQLSAAWGFAEVTAMPRMDVHETTDAVEVSAELPGMSRDDVKIEVRDDVLSISGEKKCERTSLEGDVTLAERSYGAFRRSVTLPRSVEADRISATMTDGVLKVFVPKTAGAAPRTIPIEAKDA
jgi:HSP20 family protein